MSWAERLRRWYDMPVAPTHEDVVIRTGALGELDELQRIYRAASLSNEGDAAVLSEHPELLVYDGTHLGAGRTRVAVGGDDLLGFATVVSSDGAEPELEDLFVDPAVQRRGVGRRLVADAVATATEAGHRRMWVTGNEHALDFYLAVGFVIVGSAETQLRSAPRLRLDLAP